MKNLNLKVRFRNKKFLLSFIGVLVVLANQVAGLFGYDITFITGEITEISETVLLVLGLIGVVNDPTTDGWISDSQQALTYTEPKRDDI